MSENEALQAQIEALRTQLTKDLTQLRQTATPKAGAEFVKQKATTKLGQAAHKVSAKLGINCKDGSCMLRKCPWIARVLDGDELARKQLLVGAVATVSTLILVRKLLRH